MYKKLMSVFVNITSFIKLMSSKYVEHQDWTPRFTPFLCNATQNISSQITVPETKAVGLKVFHLLLLVCSCVKVM